MTITRGKDGLEVTCDGEKCNEFLDTDPIHDFEDLREALREGKWRTRLVNKEWMHFCPDEDLDGLDL